jgi:hypothetical protein
MDMAGEAVLFHKLLVVRRPMGGVSPHSPFHHATFDATFGSLRPNAAWPYSSCRAALHVIGTLSSANAGQTGQTIDHQSVPANAGTKQLKTSSKLTNLKRRATAHWLTFH